MTFKKALARRVFPPRLTEVSDVGTSLCELPSLVICVFVKTFAFSVSDLLTVSYTQTEWVLKPDAH